MGPTVQFDPCLTPSHRHRTGTLTFSPSRGKLPPPFTMRHPQITIVPEFRLQKLVFVKTRRLK